MQEHALVVRLRVLLGRQAGLDIAVLETLAAIFEQKVHLAAGFASLHDFCVKGLGMSEDSAWRRRQAADLLRRYPLLVRELIEQRDVHLTGLALLQPIINDDNAERLLCEARGKTKRDIEAIVAREHPKPDVTSGVRRVFHAEQPLRGATQEAHEGRRSPELTASAQGVSAEDSAPVRVHGAGALPPKSSLPSKVTPVEIRAPDRYAFRAMMSAQTKAVLDDVCDLIANDDLEIVLRDALLALRGDLFTRKRRKLKRPPKQTADERRANAESRRASAEGRRANAESRLLSAEGRRAHADGRRTNADNRRPSAEGRELMSDGRELVADNVSVASGDARRQHSETRYVDAAVARAVFERDRCCQFVGESGHRCGATRNLQLHHVHAWAKGGAATLENLKVYCRAHNLYQGELEFGQWLAA